MKQGKLNVVFKQQTNVLLGANLYQGSIPMYTQIKEEETISYAARSSSVPQSTIKSVLYAMLDAFAYYLCNGHGIKFDRLGTFSLAVSAKSADPMAENPITGANAVRSLGVNFVPSPNLKQMLTNIELVRVVEEPTLPLLTDFMPVTVRSDKDTLVIAGSGISSAAFNVNPGSKIRVTGFNVPEQFDITLKGIDSENNDLEETITLKGEGVSQTSAEGVATKNFNSVDIVVINGKEYDCDLLAMHINSIMRKNDGVYISNGVHIPFVAGYNSIVVAGSNLNSTSINVDGNMANITSISANRVEIQMPLAAGNHTISTEFETISFTVDAEGAAPTPTISGATANGVTATNGQSSNMVKGSTYNFIVTGQNLNLVDKVTFGGAEIQKTVSDNNTRMTFSITPSEAGAKALKIGDNFTVNITVQEPAAAGNTIGGVANGGSLTVNGNLSGSRIVFGGITPSEAGNYAAEIIKSDNNKLTLAIGNDGGAVVTVVPVSAEDYTGTIRVYAIADPDTTLCSVSLSYVADENVTVYSVKLYTNSTPAGKIVTQPTSLTYPAGSRVPIAVKLNSGYLFDMWHDRVGGNPRILEVNSAKTLTAWLYKEGETKPSEEDDEEPGL